MLALTKEAAALELLRRREARRDFKVWCLVALPEGQKPAQHHQLIIQKLQDAVDRRSQRQKIMLLLPPGAAKSTYTSKLFVPWYLGRRPRNCIIACSHSYELAEDFGRDARNLVSSFTNILGYSLVADSKAAGKWITSQGGEYRCFGVGAGLAGRRADLGLIDDPIGSQEDADSKVVRDKQWRWYLTDFCPRLKPDAIQILICNRRHEQDLAGMILEREGAEWDVVCIPFYAGDSDPLGRKKGDHIWPEYFNQSILDMVEKLRTKDPRLYSGLYQQHPAPEEGDFFKTAWLHSYEKDELPPLTDMRVYAASDHAISLRDEGNKSCFGLAGVDSKGTIWLLPDIFWERADSDKQVEAMLRLNRLYHPIQWRAEKGHISQSIGPFLWKRMRETSNYIHLHEYTPKKDKPTRARVIQGLLALGRVRVPKFAPWWADAEHELLTFPASQEDDFVDMLAHLGNQIDTMTQPVDEVEIKQPDHDPVPTLSWVKKSAKRRQGELVDA